MRDNIFTRMREEEEERERAKSRNARPRPPSDNIFTRMREEEEAAALPAKPAAESRRRGLVQTIADLKLSAGQGAVDVNRAFAATAGADNIVARKLGDLSEGIGNLRSEYAQERRREHQRLSELAAEQGMGAEAVQAIRNFADAPIDYTAQGIGSIVGLYPALKGTAKAAAAAKLGAVGTRAAQFLGVGAPVGVGATKLSQYEEVYNYLLSKGVSPEVARERALQAQAYGLDNLPEHLVSALLGGVDVITGGEPVMTDMATRTIGRKLRDRALNVARRGSEEFGTEASQAGFEQYAGNVAAIEAGDTERDAMRGVVGSAVQEGLMGGTTGAVFGAMERGRTDPAIDHYLNELSDSEVDQLDDEVRADDTEGRPSITPIDRLAELEIISSHRELNPAELEEKAQIENALDTEPEPDVVMEPQAVQPSPVLKPAVKTKGAKKKGIPPKTLELIEEHEQLVSAITTPEPVVNVEVESEQLATAATPVKKAKTPKKVKPAQTVKERLAELEAINSNRSLNPAETEEFFALLALPEDSLAAEAFSQPAPTEATPTQEATPETAAAGIDVDTAPLETPMADEAVVAPIDQTPPAEPSDATTFVATQAQPEHKPGVIEDFGEKLGGAKKDRLRNMLNDEFADEQIAKEPFNKTWPKDLSDEIEDPFLAAFAFAARAAIPSKPRKASRLWNWVGEVKSSRKLLSNLLNSPTGEEQLRKLFTSRPTLAPFKGKVELLARIDRQDWGRIGKVIDIHEVFANQDPEQTFNNVGIGLEIDGKYKTLNTSSTGEALDKVREMLSEQPELSPSAATRLQFEVRNDSREGNYFINKKGDHLYRKLKTFPDSKAAFNYMQEHYEELAAAWEAIKEVENVKQTDLRETKVRPRVGVERRAGKDVTPEQFIEDFGFRGVEFGNWVKQGKNSKERQGLLNEAHDAFMDLAEIIGIPPKAISLNGTLGLGLGSRGGGSASAHYEPDSLVINLTKTRGAGTLAHEWFHALDNYFQRKRGLTDQAEREQSYITYAPENYYEHKRGGMRLPARAFEVMAKGDKHPHFGRMPKHLYDLDEWRLKEGVRPEVGVSFSNLVEALNKSPMRKRAELIDRGKSDGYWSRILERAARSFENYVVFKMEQEGRHNDFLASFTKVDDFRRDHNRYPYLTNEEVKPVVEAFEQLFSIIEARPTESGTELFSREPGRRHQNTHTESSLRSALDGIRGTAGVAVRSLLKSGQMRVISSRDIPSYILSGRALFSQKPARYKATGGDAKWIAAADTGRWIDFGNLKTLADVKNAAELDYRKIAEAPPVFNNALPYVVGIMNNPDMQGNAIMQAARARYGDDAKKIAEAITPGIILLHKESIAAIVNHLDAAHKDSPIFRNAMLRAALLGQTATTVGAPISLLPNVVDQARQEWDAGNIKGIKNLRLYYRASAAKEATRLALAANEPIESLDGGQWIKLPQVKEGDSVDEQEKIYAIWAGLSDAEWCTTQGYQRDYAHQGPMWVYRKGEQSLLAIRFSGDEIAEIQSRKNDGTIPPEYLKEVKNFASKAELSEHAIRTLKDAETEAVLRKKREILVAQAESLAAEGETWTKEGTLLLRDGTYATTGDWLPDKKFSIVLGSADLPRDFRDEILKKVAGNFWLAYRASATALTTVFGHAELSVMSSANSLATVGRNVDILEGASVNSLVIAGGDATLRMLASANSLISVGGEVYLHKEASADSLIAVGGDATLLEGASAKNLAMVRGYLDLGEGVSLNNLLTVGGQAFLRRRASANSLISVGENASLSEGVSVDSLIAVGGYASLYKDSSAKNLIAVGGTLMADPTAKVNPNVKSRIGKEAALAFAAKPPQFSIDEGTVHAYVDPSDNKVYVVADNIPTAWTDEQIEGLIKHEVSVHLMQMGKNDAEFKALLGQVEAMLRRGNKAMQAARDRVPADTPQEDVTQETLGYFIETNPKHSLTRRFTAWFKTVIARLAVQYAGTRAAESKAIRNWLDADNEARLIKMAHDVLVGTASPHVGATNEQGMAVAEHAAAYTKDVFNKPLPADETGPVVPQEDTEAPQAEYFIKTIVGQETTQQIGTDRVLTPSDAALALSYLHKSAVERFAGLVTDKEGKPLAIVGGFKGSNVTTSVYPGTIVGEAIRVPNAAQIWFGHNHPSGSPDISQQDLATNKMLTNLFRGSGIEPKGLLTIAGGKYAFAGAHSLSEDETGAISKSVKTTVIPVIEREVSFRADNRPLIDSSQAAREAMETIMERDKGPGLLLTDAQNRLAAWVPLPEKLRGDLRYSGGLGSIYRAISESNAVGAIVSHNGELDGKVGDGSITAAQNISVALNVLEVRVLDIINTNTNTSVAERGGTFFGENKNRFFSRTNLAGEPLPQVEPENYWQKAKAAVDGLLGDDWWDRFLYEAQDKHIDIRRMQERIAKVGGVINEMNNAYRGEELYHKRLAKRIQNALKNEQHPLMVEIRNRGLTIADLEKYLHARHAPEANREYAARNPNQEIIDNEIAKVRATIKSLQEKLLTAVDEEEKSEIMSLLGQATRDFEKWQEAEPFIGTEEERLSLSGMADTEAKEHIKSLSPGRLRDLKILAKRVDNIQDETLRLLVHYGLVKKKEVSRWKATYKHYIPLHRDEAHPDSTSHPTGQGFGASGPVSRPRVGSNEKVTNILSHIMMQREAALQRGEKGLVFKSLYLLAAQYPDNGFWKAGKAPLVRRVDKKTGLVHTIVDPSYRDLSHVIMGRIGGRDMMITLDKHNERAIRLAQSFKGQDIGDISAATNIAGYVTRWIASVNTQYNIIFGIFNFMRDIQAATLQLSTTAIAGNEKAVLGRVKESLGTIYQELRRQRKTAERGEGAEVGTSKMARMWDQLQEDGGTTGFRDLFLTPEQRMKQLNSELASIDRGDTVKAVMYVLNWLSDYNDMFENAVRLAAYTVALDKGLTREQAASISKNLTVNFNRRGRSVVKGNFWYAFLNASIQGFTRMMETLAGPAGKAIILGGVSLGAVSAMLGMAIMGGGGEDEDDNWAKIPEYIKQRSIVIPLSHDNYLAWPMPLGYNTLHNLGRKAVEMMLHRDPTKGAGHHIGDMLQITFNSANPLGTSENIPLMLTPTPLDTPVGLLQNRDWLGRPIYIEDFSSIDPTPGYTRATEQATGLTIWLSERLNSLFGGTDHVPSKYISWTPDQIEHVIAQVTGGVGREAMRTVKTAEGLLTAEETEARNIPLIGRLYGETTGISAESKRFFENIKTINAIEREIKGRERRRQNTTLFKNENPLHRLIPKSNKLFREIRELRSKRRDIIKKDAPDARARAQVVRDRMEVKMREFNRQVTAIRTPD